TKNRDILEQLIAARDARRARGLPDVILEHVRGHRGHVLNEWADERAVRGAEHAAKGTASAWSSLGGLHEKLDVSEAPRKKR
ncbi:MAG: ribonuclease, partial [Microbacterium sp.]|nr:ribonuclease [Microbacterium sp.]